MPINRTAILIAFVCSLSGLMPGSPFCSAQGPTSNNVLAKPIDRARIPMLLDQLKSADALAATRAIHELGRTDQAPEVVIPALIAALSDHRRCYTEIQWLSVDPTISSEALIALVAKEGRAVPFILAAFNTGDDDITRRLIHALALIGPNAKEALPALRKISQESSAESIKLATLGALQRIGPQGVSHVAIFQSHLGDESPDVVDQAIEGLAELGHHSTIVVPDLLKLLDEKRAYDRSISADFSIEAQLKYEVCDALGRIGSRTALEPLEDCLFREMDIKLIATAAVAMLRIEPRHEDARAQLVSMLDGTFKNAGYDTTWQAIESIASLKASGEWALESINRHLDNLDYDVRAQVVSANIDISGAKAVDVLRLGLRDSEHNVRIHTILGIQQLGVDALPLLPLMIDFLACSKCDTDSQLEIVDLLGKLGPPAKTAIPAIREWGLRHGQETEGYARRTIDLIEAKPVTLP